MRSSFSWKAKVPRLLLVEPGSLLFCVLGVGRQDFWLYDKDTGI